ncbi:MAG TPA: hypothetical protein VGG48_09880 [Rhizomicrobium sp.]|jgi:hypothetical protein
MIRTILASAAVCLLATAASANPFDAAYGNTVTQVFPDGKTFTIYVNQDGTWEQRGPDGVTKGTFAWKTATNVCFTQVSPAPKDPSQATNCNEIKGEHKVGDSWTETLPNNAGSIKMSITAGR